MYIYIYINIYRTQYTITHTLSSSHPVAFRPGRSIPATPWPTWDPCAEHPAVVQRCSTLFNGNALVFPRKNDEK